MMRSRPRLPGWSAVCLPYALDRVRRGVRLARALRVRGRRANDIGPHFRFGLTLGITVIPELHRKPKTGVVSTILRHALKRHPDQSLAVDPTVAVVSVG